MDHSVKTNQLAIISFVFGLIALPLIAIVFLFFNAIETPGSIIGIIDAIVIPARNLCVSVALITGILALREIKKKGGTKKGKILAWVGIIIGAGWMIFGLLIGALFLTGEILH